MLVFCLILCGEPCIITSREKRNPTKLTGIDSSRIIKDFMRRPRAYISNIKLKFVPILQYLCQFWRYKMVDHILKISRLGVFYIGCLCWSTVINVFMKKCCMNRRLYKSRHWIPMFIGTPCSCQERKKALV